MATRRVNFEVTPKDGTQAFWIAVDDQDVTLVNGKGSAGLDDTVEHLLIWWFGNRYVAARTGPRAICTR